MYLKSVFWIMYKVKIIMQKIIIKKKPDVNKVQIF